MDVDDYAVALNLQTQFDLENEMEAHQEVVDLLPVEFQTPDKSTKKKSFQNKNNSIPSSLVAPEWEDIDPNPDLHCLFIQYNERFFYNKLLSCEVKWSPRMTLCAGVCSYQYRSGYCSIRLSVPLLKLRPRSDLVETLLHEMIHAYLFITDGNDDHDGHGPAFHKHMHRINKEAGTKISVYHNFHDEVALYKTHWWKCDGPCQHRPPFYGMVKRSMNRAPGPNDRWFDDHQSSCGGNFIKVKEPEGYGKKKPSKRKLKMEEESKSNKDIRSFMDGSQSKRKSKIPPTSTATSNNQESSSSGFGGAGPKGNLFGFGGTSFSSSGSTSSNQKTAKKSGTVVVNPGRKVPKDNSNSGHVLNNISDSENQSSYGQGNRLGGNSLDENPNEAVRNAWINRFQNNSDDKKSKESSNKPKTVEKPSPKMTTCPVCSKQVHEMNINSHLDECLTLESLKE